MTTTPRKKTLSPKDRRSKNPRPPSLLATVEECAAEVWAIEALLAALALLFAGGEAREPLALSVTERYGCAWIAADAVERLQALHLAIVELAPALTSQRRAAKQSAPGVRP